MFWRGAGTQPDPVHDGQLTHYATPPQLIEECAFFRFQPVRILGDDYPRWSHPFFTDWYYYVLPNPRSDRTLATRRLERNSGRYKLAEPVERTGSKARSTTGFPYLRMGPRSTTGLQRDSASIGIPGL